MMTDKIPSGWQRLVADLRATVERDFPGVDVTELTADRGWLYVRCHDDRLSPQRRQRLNWLLQGFVTLSLSTCMCCGSHRGQERREHKKITCDECENEVCHA